MSICEIPYSALRAQLNVFGATHTPTLFIIDYEKKQGWCVPHPLTQQELLFNINGITNIPDAPHSPLRPSISESFPCSFEEYRQAFEIVQAGLQRGDSFLCNLTLPTPITCEASLLEIYHATTAKYKVCVPGRWVCFSPEIFITIHETGEIASHPMKGTIDASLPNAHDQILSDYKETAEHCTIVDLIRNDLNSVATHVRVEEFRYIDKIITASGKGILQVSSKVTGQLGPNYHEHLGDIIDSLLPAGSICGAPKQATRQLIHLAEKAPRGYYTGIVGYYDGKRLDSGVLIRYIEEDEQGIRLFRSGGGITINSNCHEEYREVLQKIYIPSIP